MSKSNEIYNRAIENGVSLECTCVDITINEWNKLMDGKTKANKKIVHKILKNHVDPIFLKAYNPYDSYKTETHIIYVHSAIEHFYKIQ